MMCFLEQDESSGLLTWFISLSLSLNSQKPVNVLYHVVHSKFVRPEVFINGVKTRHTVQVLCGSKVTGDFEDSVPSFEVLEGFISMVDRGEALAYKSFCRSCLVQASFINGVYSD